MAVMRSRGSGDYQASQGHSVVHDRHYRRDGTQRGTILCPGGGADELWYLSALATSDKVVQRLAESGNPVACFAAGFNWANTTNMTQVTNLRTYAQSSLGFKSGKVNLLGISMGGWVALNWAYANPTLVNAIALIIPLVDGQDLYDNNRGGYASSVSTAWGGRPADANVPARHASDFAQFPIFHAYSGDDPLCVPATQTAFAGGAKTTPINLGNVGHDITGITGNEIANFFAAH